MRVNKVGIKRGIVYHYTYRQFSWLFGVAHTTKERKNKKKVVFYCTSSKSNSKQQAAAAYGKEWGRNKQTNQSALNRDKKPKNQQIHYNRRSKNKFIHKIICALNKNNKTLWISSKLQWWQHLNKRVHSIEK